MHQAANPSLYMQRFALFTQHCIIYHSALALVLKCALQVDDDGQTRCGRCRLSSGLPEVSNDQTCTHASAVSNHWSVSPHTHNMLKAGPEVCTCHRGCSAYDQVFLPPALPALILQLQKERCIHESDHQPLSRARPIGRADTPAARINALNHHDEPPPTVCPPPPPPSLPLKPQSVPWLPECAWWACSCIDIWCSRNRAQSTRLPSCARWRR